MEDKNEIFRAIEKLEKGIERLAEASISTGLQVTELLSTFEKAIEPQLKELKNDLKDFKERFGGRLEYLERTHTVNETRWAITLSVLGAAWAVILIMVREFLIRFWIK